MAANEGDAVAICAGAQLGGTKSVFLCQNSGLTNATSPLTSLSYTFKIPLLGIVSLRGEPGGKPDEPQHELMGQITTDFLDLMRIKWEYLATHQGEAERQLEKANATIEAGEPFFFVVKAGTFSKEALRRKPSRALQREKGSYTTGSGSQLATAVERCLANPRAGSQERRELAGMLLYNPGKGADAAATTILEMLGVAK